jgi:hypothetical protein
MTWPAGMRGADDVATIHANTVAELLACLG